MSVHYRFKSALEYDTITFDGLHISVKDLKNAIVQQKRIGKSTDFDLRITNAQTQEVYDDDNALIPKNTSLLIARVPVATPKQKQWEGYGGNDTPPSKADEGGPIGKAMDLASLDAPEDDKIKAMMSQSTQDYDPSNYVKIRGANQVGPVPPSYRCYKCHQSGHWIKDCPLGQGAEAIEIKKSTGIPQSFLIPVEGPQVPGAMMMANGQYAVPALDLQAYTQKSTAPPALPEQKPEIPEDLLCSICSDLLTDAVMIPCCGNSFCDECIRGILLESEDHECPDCHEKGISPANLIPNRFLRKSVANFKNTTGYERIPTYRPKIDIPKMESPKKEVSSTPAADSTENDTVREEKTVISEADSTEQSKNQIEVPKMEDNQPEFPKVVDTDGPPGVSPKNSPVRNMNKSSDDDLDRASKERDKRTGMAQKSRRSPSRSPKRSRNRRSPSFEPRHNDDRHGTPIRDEPSGHGNYIPPVDHYGRHPNDMLPTPNILPTSRLMQGPPVGGGFVPGQPPPFHPAGPPPNFRLPPPGAPPPGYMAPGPYSVPPRPVFDPMALPPSTYVGNYVGRPRDFPERRRGRDMTPPGVIEDPLAAFNRILREKDEKRARQQRMARRASYSRSRSRSRSFTRSPPPPLRRRSRSPLRRRMSRSRSRSFSKSRSRSRSYSHSPRGSSPPPSFRRSPPPLQARRGVVQGRYRSPIRSSPSRRRVERERDFDRGGYRDKPRTRRADSRDRFYDDRDRDFDRGVRGRLPPPPSSMQQPPWVPPPHRDTYYPPEVAASAPPPPPFQNRYPQQIHHIQAERNYEDLVPPGIEQPPIPGLESEPPTATITEFDKRKRNTPPRRERDGRHGVVSPRDHEREKRDREKRKELKRSRSRSRTPERWRNPSPKSTGTPERLKKRRSRSASRDDKKKDKDRHRDHSDEDKNKKSKDKKKHKDKKDERKKKKDKKDKHHRSKDKKDKKEEFKQIVPKTGGLSDEEADDVKKAAHQSRKKHKEEDDVKRLAEERKKEERRLRFLDDDRRRNEEEAKREQPRKSSEKEEEKKSEPSGEKQPQQQVGNLYDEIIPEQDHAKEICQGFNKDTEEVADVKQDASDKSAEPIEEQPTERERLFTNKDPDEDDIGILELHNDMKLDDILAPVPEKSKWDDDASTINQEEDGQLASSPGDFKDSIDSKSKVSNEVLKRAENVIFAKAINSIRPLDVKKSSEESGNKMEPSTPTDRPRISVKERLGKKVDDPDPKVPPQLDHKRGSTSPFSRKERRIELEDRHRRHERRARSRDRERNKNKISTDKAIKKSKKEEKDIVGKHEDKAREKRKRSRSPSESEERKRRKKEKKAKKEKDRSKKSEEDVKGLEKQPKSAVEKRKPTLDEASFEPDYDLETHEDDANETEKNIRKDKAARKSEATEEESSSSDSSTSSSEEEKKKRKKKRSRKKRKRRDTSSSESDSSSESSDSEKERRRKKHRKTKKKKRKSKH